MRILQKNTTFSSEFGSVRQASVIEVCSGKEWFERLKNTSLLRKQAVLSTNRAFFGVYVCLRKEFLYICLRVYAVNKIIYYY
jgi:hypothetical protein